MVINGYAVVVAVTAFAIIHVVLAGGCVAARDYWTLVKAREAIENPDLEYGMIEDMTNQHRSHLGLRSVVAMKFSLATWLAAVDSN